MPQGASCLLDRETAKQAVSLVLPSIMEAMEDGKVKRKALAIVISDPGRLPSSELSALYTHRIGEDWGRDYMNIAMGKAEVCWRTQRNSSEVRDQHPFLFHFDEPPYAGGVYVEGLVVACSGVEAYFDEMFATMIAAACRALCIQKMQAEVIPSDRDTVG